MTTRKSVADLRKTQAVKAQRTLIRLKYALLADEELNDALPDLEEEFDRQIQDNKPITLSITDRGVQFRNDDDGNHSHRAGASAAKNS